MAEVVAVLILFMIAAAIIALQTSALLYSIISVGAVGFLLAIAFLFLGAPDVAVVQIGVEVIGLVILIRATTGRGANEAVARPAFGRIVAAVTLVAAIGLFGIQVLADFPVFGDAVMQRFADAPSWTYLQEGLAGTGAPNIVTAVLLDFRAYDTLGEATVLFCAVMGALVILRRKVRLTTAAGEREAKPR